MKKIKIEKGENLEDYFKRVIKNHKKEVEMNDIYKHRKKPMGSNKS